jgi:Ni/Fe-hydrogenase subunit HybB-like protein
MRLLRTVHIGLTGLSILAVITFLGGISGPSAPQTWQIFFINVLFWSGIAQAGLVFAAMYVLTESRWGGTIQRLAAGLGSFLPVSLVLFVVLFVGKSTLVQQPTLSQPAGGAWLASTVFRDTLGLVLLYAVGLAFLYYSIRPELGQEDREPAHRFPRMARFLVRTWQGAEVERQRSQRAMVILAPMFLVLYAVVLSLLGFDLVMALAPEWSSTLFGAYFFMSNFYLGLAAIAIITVLARACLKLHQHIASSQLADLAKLMFAFCLLTGYFLWSQYLVIWYGNLPEEVAYVVLRISGTPWRFLAWSIFFMIFVIPFVVLLSRRVKQQPRMVLALAGLIVVGMWLERYLLVMPSLAPQSGLRLGFAELTITGGFLAAMALTYLTFLQCVPILSVSARATEGTSR